MKELLLVASVFGLAVVSAFVPLVSIELVLVGAAATRSAESVLVAQVLAAAVGQMVGKSCFFLGGRAATRKELRLSPKAQAVQRFVARIAGQRAAPVLTVLVSARHRPAAIRARLGAGGDVAAPTVLVLRARSCGPVGPVCGRPARASASPALAARMWRSSTIAPQAAPPTCPSSATCRSRLPASGRESTARFTFALQAPHPALIRLGQHFGVRRPWLVLVCAALVCAASGAAAVRSVDRGIVMRVQPPVFVIRELDGTRMRFVIGPRTVITLDGRRVRLGQLRRGDVASVEHAGRRAIEVRALRP